MIGVAIGLSSFVVALALHVVIWRLAEPSKPYRALALVWFASFLLVAAGATAACGAPHVAALLYGAILGGSLQLAYMFLFVGIKHDSPTLSIVHEIVKNGERGMNTASMERFSAARPFVRARLEQLIADGFVARQGDALSMTGKVSFVLTVNEFYRRLTRRGATRG